MALPTSVHVDTAVYAAPLCMYFYWSLDRGGQLTRQEVEMWRLHVWRVRIEMEGFSHKLA